MKCKRILSLWLVLVLTIKEEMVSHVQQNISMIISMFLSLPHCAFDSFATGKRDKHGGKYGLEIPMNFHFYRLQRPLNWLKRGIKQMEESLNQTVNT